MIERAPEGTEHRDAPRLVAECLLRLLRVVCWGDQQFEAECLRALLDMARARLEGLKDE